MLCQCAKLTPLQSRFLASVVALALLALIYWTLSTPHFAYAAELEFDGSGRSRIGGEDHNWHRIARDDLDGDEDVIGVHSDWREEVRRDSAGVYVRATQQKTTSGNNDANVENIQPGDTMVWRFPKDQLMSEHAERGPGLPSDGSMASDKVEERHIDLRRWVDDFDDAGFAELEPRQDSRRIYISINTCLQPDYNGGGTPSAPPQLTLYVATSSGNTNPGPQSDPNSQVAIPLDEGYANYTMMAEGDSYMSVYAPGLPDGFGGDWNYELAVSIDDYYHSLTPNHTNLFLIDSDSDSALLVTGNLTQANSSQPSYQEWLDLKAPYILFASPSSSPKLYGLQKSYCGLKQNAQIAGKQSDPSGSDTNVQMEMITRGLDHKPKEQFYITNLDKASIYHAVLARPGNSTDSGSGVVGGGGRVWKAVNFTTKADGNCALLFNLTFCDQVAYAVPSSPDITANATRFGEFYDDYTLRAYHHFNYSLQQIPCHTTSDAQYSLARNCDDCARAYKEWLCAVSIPRCEDFSNPAPYLQVRNVAQQFLNGTSLPATYLNRSYIPMPNAPTLEGSAAYQQTYFSSVATSQSRNPKIDEVVKPGPYKEVLPCEDLCYSLVQSCPAALGFGCPYPGRGLEVSYGNRSGMEEGRVTCSYLGAYVYTDGAFALVPPRVLMIVAFAAMVGLGFGV